MNNTPETDQNAVPHIGFYSCATVTAEFARKLERERDDAREALMKIEDLFIDGTDIYADRETMGEIAREALEGAK
jgi:hypothetical protein